MTRGPVCRRCKHDEAWCAKNGGCCPTCTHTFSEHPSTLPLARPVVDAAVETARAERRLSVVRPEPADCLPPELIGHALRLVGAVRSRDPRQVTATIGKATSADLRRIVVCLAALVPADQSAGELLAWNDTHYLLSERGKVGAATRWAKKPLQPCGTHAAFVRHKTRGEDPDEVCVVGERRYQRDRARLRRAPVSVVTSTEAAL